MYEEVNDLILMKNTGVDWYKRELAGKTNSYGLKQCDARNMLFDTTVAKKAKNGNIFDTTDFYDFNVLNSFKFSLASVFRRQLHL
ncbi:hypothetical protein WKO21_004563 [Shigella boydii]|nr:hypothetical protein [Escherichia coli]EFW0444605.1 hypothetical protein [Shigella boydii]EFX5203996.1 hypothetical protein [Shigella flexneri]EFK3876252.1 hypothetical protein [Escherichia coli]EFW7050776.1 hypothetical protein [Shigella boydii]EHM8879910.1 hypothetical protein [Escherichia coli]